MTFNPLDHPICWARPDRFVPSASLEHLPFGMLAVDLVRPALLVEIGVSTGVMYCGFCQAIASLGLRARAVGLAADPEWDHTGMPPPSAVGNGFEALRHDHDPRYSAFSELVSGLPARLIDRFADRSIDLLSMAASATDALDASEWNAWLRKLSPKAVVLLRGINHGGRERGAGLRWNGGTSRYPSFELPHGAGLGLLAIGSDAPPALRVLTELDAPDRTRVQTFFAALGRTLRQQAELSTQLATTSVSATQYRRERERDISWLQDVVVKGQEALHSRDEAIGWLQGELAESRQVRERLQALSESLTDQLHEILGSRGWRWLMRYRRAKERFGRHPGAAHADHGRAATPSRSNRMGTETGPGAPFPAAIPDTLESVALLPSLQHAEAARVLGRSLPDDARHRADIVCLSIIDWEFRYQRPQQLMSQFAAHGHRVFYVSASRFRTGGAGELGVRLIKDRIYEVQLAAPRTPDIYREVIAEAGAASVLDSLDELRRTYDVSSAIAYVEIASWTDVAIEAARRWGWPVVYDCQDEWENFPGIGPAIVEAERRLVQHADLVVVSAARLEEKWRPYGRPMVLARNAVDFDFYASRCQPNQLLADVPHPIVGYFGAIADWFDIDLLVEVARQRPQYTFVLLGGVFGVDVESLKALPNVRLLGQQPYGTMPRYLYHFDACIIPFKINPITDATDPVKLYEYLSAGKPVVSVRLPELESCREHVYLADTPDEFLGHLDRAVTEDDRAAAERRRQFAARHTWTDRYRRIRAALGGACEPASIIVVTYNNVLLTQLCLESLLRHTGHPNFEIIVVDNASTDGTRAYLRHMADRHPEIRLILNTKNEGFAHANNQGLAQSQGRHLVLLNNDTVVPSGWLARLIHHLRDSEIGLVGPVTNFVGNEAKVEVSYTTWAEMNRFAAERARRFEGHVADIDMLAMYCVAMRRDLFERVGPLDERFGIGMFEDDDYSHRVRAIGCRVVCAADAFVHHIGQAAFKVLIQNGEYDALFERNRRLFEEKWRVQWRPHEHAALAFAPSQTSAPVVAGGTVSGRP